MTEGLSEMTGTRKNMLFCNFTEYMMSGAYALVFFYLSWVAGQFSKPVILLGPGWQLGGYNYGGYANLMVPRWWLPEFHTFML